jgi:exodeoxyribonuclease-3
MREWLDGGWTDEYRRFHPDDIGYTWYGYRGRNTVGRDQGLRLDYFLTNKIAGQSVKNCYIDMEPRLAEKPTDHAGLVLEMETPQ